MKAVIKLNEGKKMFGNLQVLVLAVILGAGSLLAGESAPADQGPKQTKLTGVVLINPENANEAMLLVQVMVPDDKGEVKPQVIGVPLAINEQSRKLIKEYGVTAAKPDSTREDQNRVEAEAKTKVVVVSGVMSFGEDGPKQLTVESYAKSKDLVDTAVPAGK